ncbi:hypothetical protein H5407_13755 [Mitsuaria sp. WAJ17]|uniref:hypothetical protein n=1 Tax=Mitsuaria sp. WAJ17 TaxID=2761452 RepID=UPI00160432DD|nr:hypothetical protein [Mitsuaria sp. WAJ17]MBB2486283.1 hypothetical protein [Mitsuaria sp. WAJ17]
MKYLKRAARRTALVAVAAMAANCLLPACAWAERVYQAHDSDLSKRARTVGVMVLSGSRARVQQIGTLLISKYNEFRFEPRDDDLLTDAIYRAVQDELMMEARYEVSRLPVDLAFARNVLGELWDPKTGVMNPWPEALVTAIKAAPTDAVLLIVDGTVYNSAKEAGFFVGPNFVAKGNWVGGGDPTEAHLRFGLRMALFDPVEGKPVRTGYGSDRPDYSPDVATLWPAGGGRPTQAQWQLMADYLGSLKSVYRRALHETGLRPSCALPFYESNRLAQSRGESPPPTLPGTDPARCQ